MSSEREAEAGLERYFMAEFWSEFGKSVEDDFARLPDKLRDDLHDLNLPEDVRRATLVLLQGQARSWLNQPVPVLSGARPIDLLANPTTANAVREALMRFPA